MGAYGSPELLPRIYPEGRRLKDTYYCQNPNMLSRKNGWG